MRRNLEFRATGLEEIDKRLWRLNLDHAVSHDDIGTMSAAFVGFELRDAETHWRAVVLGRGWRERNPDEGERRGQR